MGNVPIRMSVDSAVTHTPATHSRASDLHLLRDCLTVGAPPRRRPPAKVRLEEALGPDFTRRLLSSLSETGRH